MSRLLSLQILLILLLGSCPTLFAQQKYEAERKLNSSDVPDDALQFIRSLALKSKVKWYREEGLHQQSIEAKYRFKGQKYSIEFDTSGVIQDVEIEVQWSEIPELTQQEITSYLSREFDDFKLVKIQIQYVGNRQALLSKLQDDSVNENYETNYELVVKGKKAKKTNLFESLFTEQGAFISTARIVLKSSDHLEY